ncbi:MAG TPA: histidine triad nucleotide-binding protein [Patescibacteria group bacterium]
MPHESPCLFCRISNKDLSASIVYEDENVIAFNDIHPKAKVHVLVIPKKHIQSLADAEDEDQELLGMVMLTVKKVAEEQRIASSGYRTIINTRTHGGQEVDHLHVHILGGEAIGPMVSK